MQFIIIENVGRQCRGVQVRVVSAEYPDPRAQPVPATVEAANLARFPGGAA